MSLIPKERPVAVYPTLRVLAKEAEVTENKGCRREKEGKER